MVNLGPIALFSNFKVTTISGKHLVDVSPIHIVFLMYKLLTTSRSSDDLSYGFDRDRGKGRDELTNDKNIRGVFHVRIMLKHVFGFAQHKENATYGLGYKLPLTRNKDAAILDKAAGFADARILNVFIGMYSITHPRFHNKVYYLNKR